MENNFSVGEDNSFGSWLEESCKAEGVSGPKISSTTPLPSFQHSYPQQQQADHYVQNDSPPALVSTVIGDLEEWEQDSILRRILSQDTPQPMQVFDLLLSDPNNNNESGCKDQCHKREGKGVSWKAKPSWAIYVKDQKETLPPFLLPNNPYTVDHELNALVGLNLGDTCISKFAADAVVTCTNENFNCNPAADTLCLYEEGGSGLEEVCKGLTGLPLGEVTVTDGFNLSAKYVMHTTAPTGDCPQWKQVLEDCYLRCLQIMEERGLRTIVFPCISMGYKTVPGIPTTPVPKTTMPSLEPHVAAIIALKCVRGFLERNKGKVDRIIFSLHDDAGIVIYRRFMQICFPMDVT